VPANLHSRIMDNGTGWYWEIVTETHEVLARGEQIRALKRAQNQCKQRREPNNRCI
jgi:hypothetical protein